MKYKITKIFAFIGYIALTAILSAKTIEFEFVEYSEPVAKRVKAEFSQILHAIFPELESCEEEKAPRAVVLRAKDAARIQLNLGKYQEDQQQKLEKQLESNEMVLVIMQKCIPTSEFLHKYTPKLWERSMSRYSQLKGLEEKGLDISDPNIAPLEDFLK